MNIIGVMTGNSMDAIDCVLTEFNRKGMRDIAACSADFSNDMREKVAYLRHLINDKKISMPELAALPTFHETHDEYIRQVATCVNDLVAQSGLEKSEIDAIGFHGKTLDHLPPSVIQSNQDEPFTLQIGSGQMLADLTGIRVIYDFRSDDIMAGGEGAPLVPPHNAHIARQHNALNSVFYNAGNTSNLAIIQNGKAVQGWDAGPFNEFTDKLIRAHTDFVFDTDGKIAQQGKLLPKLLEQLFEKTAQTSQGENYYLLPPSKSGDPAYYHYEAIDAFQNPENLADVVYTAEYFSAYIAAHTLQYADFLPSKFILFGGGWRNPVTLKTFQNLLNGTAYVLPQHTTIFENIRKRFTEPPVIELSDFGHYMEARLMADLAYAYLTDTPWTTPELTGCEYAVVLGTSRTPGEGATDDKINRAAKGWQKRVKK